VADEIPDELYQVNLRTGTSTKIATPDTDLHVSSLSVNADGTTLFVHDAFTGTIKKLNL
jgi:hypothetical protein